MMNNNLVPGKPRDFQCSQCPSSLPSKKNLTAHIHRHVKEKVFTCNHCVYATSKRSDLTRHQKTVHEKLAPFKCTFPDCKYSTGRNDHLQTHRRIHETNYLIRRPFPCNFEGCDYRAATKWSLSSHIRRMHVKKISHSFVCALCPASYHKEASLDEHINAIHLKRTIYDCSQCDFTSSRSKDLKIHAKTKHGRGSSQQVGQEASGHKSSSSSLQRKQVRQQRANVEASGRTELDHSAVTEAAPTAGISNNDEETRGDFLRIIQCCFCDFTGTNEQEARDHATVCTDYLVL